MFKRPLWFVLYNEIKVADWPAIVHYLLALAPLPFIGLLFYSQFMYVSALPNYLDSIFTHAAMFIHVGALLQYFGIMFFLTIHYFKPYYRPDETSFNSLRNQLGLTLLNTVIFVAAKKLTLEEANIGLLLLCILDFFSLLVLWQFYTAFERTRKVFKINETMMNLPWFGRQLLTYAIHDLCRDNVKVLGGEDEIQTMLRKIARFICQEGKELTPAFWNKHYDALYVNKNKVSNNLGVALLRLNKYYYVEYLFEVALSKEDYKMTKRLRSLVKRRGLLNREAIQYLSIMQLEVQDRVKYVSKDINDTASFYQVCEKFCIENETAVNLLPADVKSKI